MMNSGISTETASLAGSSSLQHPERAAGLIARPGGRALSGAPLVGEQASQSGEARRVAPLRTTTNARASASSTARSGRRRQWTREALSTRRSCPRRRGRSWVKLKVATGTLFGSRMMTSRNATSHASQTSNSAVSWEPRKITAVRDAWIAAFVADLIDPDDVDPRSQSSRRRARAACRRGSQTGYDSSLTWRGRSTKRRRDPTGPAASPPGRTWATSRSCRRARNRAPNPRRLRRLDLSACPSMPGARTPLRQRRQQHSSRRIMEFPSHPRRPRRAEDVPIISLPSFQGKAAPIERSGAARRGEARRALGAFPVEARRALSSAAGRRGP